MVYNFKEIERKWQKRWEKEKTFEASEDTKKPKFYVLEMFPYPSGGGLHMGHAWNYTIGDILARFKKMKGFNVLHPMGYDSFGLPAENAAIKEGVLPEEYTEKAIKNYIRQQKALGLSYDWSRVVITSHPDYYKWDQWIFLKMFEKGLVYKKESSVNWCPECKTVLANEQVNNGKCWRHEETEIKIKNLSQWYLKITEYEEELNDFKGLKNWPEPIKKLQKNWIGKSYGTEIDFEIIKKWSVFTTRPDTIFGVTFMVVSAQHPRLNELVTKEQKKEVDAFLKKMKSVSEKDIGDLEKEGAFTGAYAINPATGEKIPVWTGNFVIADYGSGMVMGVPAHDQRDFEFAIKYSIPIKKVISPENFELSFKDSDRAYTGIGTLVNSGKFNGIQNTKAKEKITKWLEEKKVGRKKTNFRLRDWGISRQRYWGTPIPMIHCPKCGIVPVSEKNLPVELPKEVKFGNGNPLETNEEWIKVKCPVCGGKAKRETDTMDTFVNSSWYFLRYCDPKNSKEIFNPKKVKKWCPIDSYIGGAEHACMHLIYFRFYTKFLRDLGLIDFDEPTKKLFNQGMLHAEGGEKMSKSKGNIVLPETVSDSYGIDTARFFLSSLASPEKDINWSENGIVGSLRFIKKILNYYENLKMGKDSKELISKLNKTIKNITDYYEDFKYRKATIELRELFDLISKTKSVSKKTAEIFLKLLSPVCPHITEELWEKIGNKDLISTSSWPESDQTKINHNEKKTDLNSKTIENIKRLIKKIKKNKIKKIYIYVMPFEERYFDEEKLSKELGMEVKIFATNNKEIYDPEKKAKKSKPGRPSIYFS